MRQWERLESLPITPSRSIPVSVEYYTALVDEDGLVYPLQKGFNMITDYGMDNACNQGSPYYWFPGMAFTISEAQTPLKRLPDNLQLTITVTDPLTIQAQSSEGFFVEQDVGRTLYIDGFQELVITEYVNSTTVNCQARGGKWIPGLELSSGTYSNWGIHYTNTEKVESKIATSWSDDPYDEEPSGWDKNNRCYVYVTDVISGILENGATVRTIAWGTTSADQSSAKGLIALQNPDVIPPGKKYRIKLRIKLGIPAEDFFITANNVDLGPYVGTVNLQAKVTGYSSWGKCFYWPGTVDDGLGILPSDKQNWTEYFYGVDGVPEDLPMIAQGVISRGSYQNGTFMRQKTIEFPSNKEITDQQWFYTGFYSDAANNDLDLDFIIYFDQPISKQLDVWFKLTFETYLRRQLIN